MLSIITWSSACNTELKIGIGTLTTFLHSWKRIGYGTSYKITFHSGCEWCKTFLASTFNRNIFLVLAKMIMSQNDVIAI